MSSLSPALRVHAFADLAWGKDKLHLRKGAQPSAIVRQVRTLKHRRLGADEEVRENHVSLSFSRLKPAKRHTCSPGGFECHINALENRKVQVNRVLGSPPRRELSIRNRADCQLIAAGAHKENIGAFGMIWVRAVQPRDNNGSIDEDHGRVLRSNSAPDSLPSHVPDRSRMCLWALFIFLQTRIDPSSCNVQLSGVAGPMPACRRIFGGIGPDPFDVTTVAISTLAYGFGAFPSNCPPTT
jgi:hypothetical protein